MRHACPILILLVCLSPLTFAQESMKTVDFGIFENCPLLENDSTRVVLCPQQGGRVLEYSLGGVNSLFVSDYDQTGQQSETRQPNPSAGRFDFGPEHIVAPRKEIFQGEWTTKPTGPLSVQLTSQVGTQTGVVLVRDFHLDPDSSRLVCTQTIKNVSDKTIQHCHWSRTLANKAGIVLIPLEGFPRFKRRYVRYDGGKLIMNPQDENIRIRGDFLEIIGPPPTSKLGMDSYAGWLAHQQPTGLLFIKQFPTYPNRNYNEVAAITISTWAPPSGETVELEPIGPSETLRPGESASFTEIWSLHRNPYPEDGQTVDLEQLQAVHDTLPETSLEGPQE